MCKLPRAGMAGIVCFLLLSLLQPFSVHCRPDDFPDAEPDPRYMNETRANPLPSDVDVGHEYSKTDQVVTSPRGPRRHLQKVAGSGNAPFSGEGTMQGWSPHSHQITGDSMDQHVSELAGEEGFMPAEKVVCEYDKVKALKPIHGGDAVMRLFGHQYGGEVRGKDFDARSDHVFSCATLTNIPVKRYCNGRRKVSCTTKNGSFQPFFKDKFNPDGSQGQTALPVQFCQDFLHAEDRGWATDSVGVRCVERSLCRSLRGKRSNPGLGLV